ncbi:hypothetical protein P152DRAFT_392191 [Eremomyces bilateralis CBS 781.70]|uniref:ER transporter 6TM N-terminal domain-containing protein n=1 Tax=Eremomyces bilateralis CBS 781.70 TaxID=1392243 RepID=A0A6G1GB26_9PEZI|nr:uncharacterized protein P152DRAFT_392191 [Eremomyces bilateralis CBS 781.70]KAF1815275.1 hypothetical protein P152DRAFT_392191 [Eremomyces bilateralis CBS 781.70]
MDRSNAKAKETKKKSLVNMIKTIWAKLGLDAATLMLMAKGGIAPAIAAAMYQSTAVANVYQLLGYLMAVVSLLGFAIMPRAKFIQTMMFNIISICFATAVSLLCIYCVTEARRHSNSPGSDPTAYNSSASAVAGIWLFFQIYLVNAVKSAYPQFTFPTILYAIFTNVSATFSPQFPNMTAGVTFATRLLTTFLTGFGIATGVSLFIVPRNCRTTVFKGMEGYIKLLQSSIKAHNAYFTCLEGSETLTNLIRVKTTTGKKPAVAEAEEVKKTFFALAALHGKLSGDLKFAKREVAYGKLGPQAIGEISKHLREILLPTIGISSVIDIFDRLADHDWRKIYLQEEEEESEEIIRSRIVEDWTSIMTIVKQPFGDISIALDQGLQHISYVLQFSKPPRAERNGATKGGERDIEAEADVVKPGHKEFLLYLERQAEAFALSKESILRAWCEDKGVTLSEDFFRDHSSGSFSVPDHTDFSLKKRNQRQLFVLLYMHYLLGCQMKAILALVRYSDKKKDEGTFLKKHLIVPGHRRFAKWIRSIGKLDDGVVDHESDDLPDLGGTNTQVHLGQAYNARKDPEHLPAQGWIEKIGDGLRKIPRFFRSQASAFGFRAACATMSIGIMAYLNQTQRFFNQHRLVWAMIMTAISMSPTTGRSFNSFALRILGTLIATVVAFLIYYIPNGKTPGVIVFLWFFVSLGHYIPIKAPAFTIAGMISMVTITMITAYELEANKIGEIAVASNGQLYYPLYLLAPYRLAIVTAGLAVAFLWTIIPYPISEHSELRKSLGGCLYLLANYYSIVHETVHARIRGDEGDLDDKYGPGRRMQKVRNKIYSKQILILDGLRTYSSFLKWEIPIGGRFPKKQYDRIIDYAQHIFNYMSLISYASQTYSDLSTDSATQWFSDFRAVIGELKPTSQAITSLLSLLSASILNGQPLPPYLMAPQPYVLSRRLEELDKDILSLRHIGDPGYAAFAVIQISARCISSDLDKLLRATKELVGELDFTFHTVKTHEGSPTSSSSSLFEDYSGKRGKND